LKITVALAAALLAVAPTAITGCTNLLPNLNLPSEAAMARADFGPYPNNYEQIVKANLEPRLIDPGSIQYRRITSPRKFGWVRGEAFYGWAVCVEYNAKNRTGGYSGFSYELFLIRNNGVIMHGEQGDIDQVLLERGCF
jgi:hypothetical protein